jgi:hypothetical protein
VERGQLGRGVRAELVGQPLPGLLVDLQGGGAAAAGMQRAHQPGGQRLAQRVRHHQLLELGHQRLADAGQQVGVDALLDGGQPQLVEPGDDRRAELGLGHVGQGRAAP